MSATTDTLTGPCTGCGREVRRDLTATAGFIRAAMARAPLVCDACIAEADRVEAERERLRAAREAARRHEARLRHSGLPAALLGIRWDDIDRGGREQPLAAAHRWATGELHGLVLAGPVGVGKTRIAAAAANAMLERRALRWTSAPLLFARLGHGMGTTGREEAIDVLVGAHPLVLDDLDKARPTEFGAEQIFAAIDSRITEGVPLLVTTNLGSRQLATKWPEPFGEAITSRLAGYGEAHQLGGTDRRIQPRQEGEGQ